MPRLTGKTALITGGGSGIGRATARLFAAEGARVVVAGRRHGPLEAVVDEIRAAGGQGVAAVADLTDSAGIEAVVADTVRAFGIPNVLVNNAGLFEARGRLHETSPEAFNQSLAVNLRAPFLLMRAIVPLMLTAGGGSIVNVGSNLAQFAIPNASAYCAAKGGLLMLTRAAAMDYAADGIRCNMVSPGLVRTEMTAEIWRSPSTAAEVVREYPAGRFGEPEEIAQAILHFASDESGWTTGAVLNVDGGASAR